MVIQNLGVSSLAGVLQTRVKAVSNQPSVVDIGEIQEDGALICNQFPCPIPKTDYMVCRSLLWGEEGELFAETRETGGELEGNGAHSHEILSTEGHSHGLAEDLGHLHHVLVGKKFRSLQSGDRVLVVWTDSREVCVVDLIFKASEVHLNG